MMLREALLCVDLFGGAPKTNGHAYIKPVEDPFRYICGVFSGDGAVEILKEPIRYLWNIFSYTI